MIGTYLHTQIYEILSTNINANIGYTENIYSFFFLMEINFFSLSTINFSHRFFSGVIISILILLWIDYFFCYCVVRLVLFTFCLFFPFFFLFSAFHFFNFEFFGFYCSVFNSSIQNSSLLFYSILSFSFSLQTVIENKIYFTYSKN